MTKRKLHNPKAHSPAVYIPCWLIQVPISKLSPGAKIFYGRISQWSNASGIVYRSIPQMARELGTSERQVARYVKELKSVELLGTYHPQAGGVNYFEFYDHPWMYEPLVDELIYKSDPPSDPMTDVSVPHDRCVSTPMTDVSSININKVKENKKYLKPLGDSSKSPVGKENYRSDLFFLKFYENYPRKEKPHDAYKEFIKYKPTHEMVDFWINDINNRLKFNWNGRNKSKIPQPATYLQKKEWEGELFIAPYQSSNTPRLSLDQVMGA